MAKGKSYKSGGVPTEDRLNILEQKRDTAIAEKNIVKAKEYSAAIAQVTKNIERQNILQEASLNNMTEMSDSIKSLGAGLGKNNKLFETMNLFSAQMQGTVTSISSMLNGPTLIGARAFAKQTFKTVEASKSLGNTIAINGKKLAKQQITQSQYNQSVLDGYEDIEEQIDRLTTQMQGMNQEELTDAKKVIATLKEEKDILESVAKAAEKSKKNFEGIGFAMDTLSSTGIPGLDKLGDVIMKAKEGGIGLTLSFAALGAALGKMAYDLGFFGDKLKTVAGYDKKLAGLKGQIAAINQQVNLGIFGGRNFVKESAILDFSNTVTQLGIEFEAASKTALFGDKLGGVGYGAAQLQMAGIAAETIATAMKDASSAMGSNVNGKFGADMALLAARTGQTSEGIASISDTFMRLDGVSKETSLNMQEGLRTMAKQANINLGALMEDVAAASKDALSYQIKSGPALAKAATFAQSLGTKFTDIATAGRNMVLNYKDSIKAEMSLSAMLGRRVDLSQVRALFAAGKTEEAIKALKAQGLDPSKMNMFQQEQLKNATGGLDLNTAQKIATRTGRTGGELTGENIGKGNKKFIETKIAAESTKAIASAVASAMVEVQKALLESQAEMQRQTAIENNTQGLKDLMYTVERTEMSKTISTGIGTGLSMLVGAGLFGGISRLLKGGATASSSTSVASAVENSVGGNIIKSPSLATTAEESMATTAIKGGSKLGKFAKGAGGVLAILTAAMDFSDRKTKGQTNIQAGMGAGLGAAGGMTGAAYGAALGSVVPVFGTIVGGLIGGAVGYFGGSSIADALTGANEPTVKAQEQIETELTSQQVKQAVTDGKLLSDSSYTIELQKEMVAQLGLSTTLLYDIAENNRGLFQSVNIDGKRVMEALASTSRRQFGVARNIMPTTTTK